MKILLYFIAITISLTACTSARHVASQVTSGSVALIVKAYVGKVPFSPDSIYKTPTGESFSIKTLKFFISDLALSNAAAKESKALYSTNSCGIHLIDLSSGLSDTMKLAFPEGAYSDFRFTMGVPRTLNHQDPASAPAPLDLGNDDMFWEWNSGYIFFLLDGKTDGIKDGLLHVAIGNDSRLMPFWFGDLFDREPLVKISSEKKTVIEIQLDLLQLFKNGDSSFYSINTIDRAIVHNGHHADVLRNNLMQAIRVEVR